jgi:WD40 repeat protein
MNDLDALLKARGISGNLTAYVTSCGFNRAGSVAAFALGDGTVRLTGAGDWISVPAHEGAVLALAQDFGRDGFITGGDDGLLLRVTSAGEVQKIASFGMKWVEHVAVFAAPKGALLACAVGKNIHLFDGDGNELRKLTHSSTVSGIVFDGKGKRIAASHYNGASIWFTASASAPKTLEWKGSHLGVALHPAGEAIVTAMQENALHGWTLPEGKHMRMSGYPAKTQSFGFTRSGKWLATGGADALVLWPFFGGGPMGKAPMELGASGGAIITRVACHPEHEVVACGFDNGLVIVADILKEKILSVCGPGRGAVSALAWNGSGSHLALGTEDGFAAVVDFSRGGG